MIVDQGLRHVLVDAVPELPAPPDRVAAVAARVQRGRRVTGSLATVAVAFVVAAVGLAIGVPRLGGPTPANPFALPVPEDACPTTPPQLPAEPADRPGQLVPTGAVRVALCQTAIQAEPSPAAQLLGTGVDSLVSLLNALPELPAGATWRCAQVGFRYTSSLLFRYPDREPVLVQVDRNCQVAQVDGRTRAYSEPDPIERFEALYRGQLAAQVDPATVAAPECPQVLATAAGPRDDISHGKGLNGQALPTELAAATFCRYFGSHLSVTSSARDGLAQLRDALNQTFGPDRPSTTCVTGPATVTDTVAVVDGTGDVVEFWLERRPCAVGIRTGWGAGILPTPDLLGRVDAALGGPPPA